VHICLIASELFGFGIAGGFGFATRSLGRNLVSRGHRVTAVIPQPVGLSERVATLDGISVCTFPRDRILRAGGLYREIDADVYHSQEPSLSTYVAQRSVPYAEHVVTARDPRNLWDWWIELKYPSRTRIGVLRTAAFYENPFTRLAVRNAQQVFVPARCLTGYVQRKYALPKPPAYLPTPIPMPKGPLVKARRPTLCFVGRLDRRKRPDLFLSLASGFPQAELIVAGGAQDARYERELLDRFGHAENLRMLGFVDQFSSSALSDLFAGAWIMVNTAAREGLPNVFIEAAAHGCAIVSPHDPDGFASRFGWHCPDEDFAGAVEALLDNDLWRSRGAAGAAYVRGTNEAELATDRHVAAYHTLLGRSAPSADA
jgi:glycosyltransferase involved in cell wall biosynthesis